MLGIGNTSMATKKLDADERSAVSLADTRSKGGAAQARKLTIVSESGLYALILRSDKPEEAKRFRKWVTGEAVKTTAQR